MVICRFITLVRGHITHLGYNPGYYPLNKYPEPLSSLLLGARPTFQGRICQFQGVVTWKKSEPSLVLPSDLSWVFKPSYSIDFRPSIGELQDSIYNVWQGAKRCSFF